MDAGRQNAEEFDSILGFRFWILGSKYLNPKHLKVKLDYQKDEGNHIEIPVNFSVKNEIRI